jgi:hypothetical protein
MVEDKQYTWTDKDIIVDHTKKVKKLWDLVIPETEKYIEKFTTNGVKWVEHRKGLGPYHITEKNLKYDVDVVINLEPLRNIGWDGEELITNEMFDKAYGKDFDYNLRSRMREILGYVGLSNIGSFDFKGDINYMGDD